MAIPFVCTAAKRPRHVRRRPLISLSQMKAMWMRQWVVNEIDQSIPKVRCMTATLILMLLDGHFSNVCIVIRAITAAELSFTKFKNKSWLGIDKLILLDTNWWN